MLVLRWRWFECISWLCEMIFTVRRVPARGDSETSRTKRETKNLIHKFFYVLIISLMRCRFKSVVINHSARIRKHCVRNSTGIGMSQRTEMNCLCDHPQWPQKDSFAICRWHDGSTESTKSIAYREAIRSMIEVRFNVMTMTARI